MDKKALSEITVFNKYAKFVPEANRRENWTEIIGRNAAMHKVKYPKISNLIEETYTNFVVPKRVLPSMRSLQFGGKPILMAENRTFNCAYAPLELTKFYSELMFLLLGGTGMGYSVQQRHTGRLPKIKSPESIYEYKYQIQDSIIGWSDAIKIVSKAFYNGGTLPVFDYRDIRDKGEDLVTSGGKAPGPDPLRLCIENIIPIFQKAVGRHQTPLEAHDIACLIADAVLAGGIRRAAMICLFDRDDMEMLTCKSMSPVREYTLLPKTETQLLAPEKQQKRWVEWVNVYGIEGRAEVDDYTAEQITMTNKLPWYLPHPARARANNSVVLKRGEVTEAEFRELMNMVEESGCGEPGIYWTNNKDWGTNPCAEISLRPYQMCNLTEINAGAITDQDSFNEAAKAAAFLGTLQAGYTDFHYLNPKWKIACEKEALLGVSMTGIASGTIEKLNSEEAAQHAVATNREIAALIGIKSAARVTTVKPAGTTSLVLGTSSGIHAWHAPYYIRRMRAGKSEALAQYMMRVAPDLVEEDVTNDKQVVLSFPQKAPKEATLRDEPMLSLLERVKKVSSEWVANGHISGINRHNVSCTISVKTDEWEALATWMWANRESYSGISVLPYYGATAYPQMPFEDITEEQYNLMLPSLQNIDISQVFEEDGASINLKAELACGGGACEITM